MPRGLLNIETSEEAKNNDARDPDQRDNNGNAVEVSLGNTGRTKVRRHSPTKHVRQAATTTAVEQNHQRQQDAGQSQNNLKHNAQYVHNYLLGASTTINGWSGLTIQGHVLGKPNNGRKLPHIEACASHQSAIDVLTLHESSDIA
jgi:hypothetical protein